MPTHVDNTISVYDAAKRLGVDYSTLQHWLREPSCPFGHAVKCEKTYRYIIPAERFETYLSGRDLLYESVAKMISDVQRHFPAV